MKQAKKATAISSNAMPTKTSALIIAEMNGRGEQSSDAERARQSQQHAEQPCVSPRQHSQRTRCPRTQRHAQADLAGPLRHGRISRRKYQSSPAPIPVQPIR